MGPTKGYWLILGQDENVDSLFVMELYEVLDCGDEGHPNPCPFLHYQGQGPSGSVKAWVEDKWTWRYNWTSISKNQYKCLSKIWKS